MFSIAACAHAQAASSTLAACTELAQRLPNVSLALCQAANLQPVDTRSVQGRPLWLREVLPPPVLAVNTGAPPLKVLVVGGIHGDEMSSASLALHWIALASERGQTQQDQAERGPAAAAPNIHWLFVPALNPDGLLARPSKRTNAHGVDLNRNFPTRNWAQEAPVYWSQRTRKDPRRWPGKAPLSEPESSLLVALVQRFEPNLIVSIHAPYGLLDFDGPLVAGASAVAPPARLGRLYLDQVGIFPGSLGNWGGLQRGVPVVTVELPSAQRTPPAAEMRQMWLDLLRWMDQRLVVPPGPVSSAGRGAENTTAR